MALGPRRKGGEPCGWTQLFARRRSAVWSQATPTTSTVAGPRITLPRRVAEICRWVAPALFPASSPSLCSERDWVQSPRGASAAGHPDSAGYSVPFAVAATGSLDSACMPAWLAHLRRCMRHGSES
ncbi:MAG: hypothetical protein ACPIOQ_37705 [Promethearchaeia archaeon]